MRHLIRNISWWYVPIAVLGYMAMSPPGWPPVPEWDRTYAYAVGVLSTYIWLVYID